MTKGEYAIISGRINDIAWDGDSQRIIAVGDGKQRYGHCITADSGNTVGEISGHAAQVNSVSIRQQRPLRAATAGDDRNIVFYHGAPFRFNSIPGRGEHANFIYSVAFSPDGHQLVSAGGDRKILLHDGKTGEYKAQLSKDDSSHTGSIFGTSWAPDSRRLATASADRTVKIWDVEAGKAIQTVKFTNDGIVDVSDQQVGVTWVPGRSDGLLISLSLNGDINYLNQSSEKPTRVISGHQKNITTLELSGNVSTKMPTLWTGSYDGRLCVWDIADGTAKKVDGESHTNLVSGLAATSGKHPQLFSVGWDDTLRSTDIDAVAFSGQSTKLSSQPKTLTSTADGMVVVSQVDDVVIFSNGQQAGELPLISSPTSLAANGNTVAVGASDSSLTTYSVTEGHAPKKMAFFEKVSAAPITALSFTIDGSMIAVGDSSGKLFVFKVGESSLDLVTNRWSGAHTAKVTCIAWNERGTHAVSGGLDTNIFAWSIKDPGARVKASNAHKEGINGIAWYGEKIISCGTDATIKFWSVLNLK